MKKPETNNTETKHNWKWELTFAISQVAGNFFSRLLSVYDNQTQDDIHIVQEYPYCA